MKKKNHKWPKYSKGNPNNVLYKKYKMQLKKQKTHGFLKDSRS
jgi:hypothetical protein